MREITYCLSCKKDTKNINPKIVKIKISRQMMLSKCQNNIKIIKSLHLLHKDLVCSII